MLGKKERVKGEKYMSITIKEAVGMISKMPRKKLGFFPTPLYRLDALSEELGVNLWIKRDDFTGSNLFGGNKTPGN